MIVLVITIIVMIILASSIILSLSNSGIIEKANKAKIDSDLASIKELISVYEAECKFNNESVTLDNVKANLEENGVKTEKVIKDEMVITNISLDKTSVEMEINSSAEINIIVEQEEITKERLYAIIQDKYYEIYENAEGNLDISNEENDVDNPQKVSINIKGNAANITVPKLSNDGSKITIYSNENGGQSSVTIKYGEK